MSDFKVEKGLAIPTSRRGKAVSNYPWTSLEVGDSFFVKFDPNEYHALKYLQQAITGSAYAYRDIHCQNFKITTRQMGDGVRVWRTA